MQFSTDDLRTPESLERVLRQFEARINTPVQIPATPPLDLTRIAGAVAPLIQSALQAPGAAPLNLTALLPSSGGATVVEDTHANRLALYPAGNYSVGALFYETDRASLYVVVISGGTNVWQYVSGLYAAVFANRPTDLGLNDRGFLLFVTVQCHLMWWSGTAWFFLDGGGGYFQDFVATPPGSLGWQLCDGTATDYLVISGADLAVTSFTTPDLTTAPSGVYRKSIAAYTGTINAATAGAMSGLTGSTTATNQSNTTGITVDAHTVVQDAQDGADHWDFDAEADAAHTVNDPGHNHTQDAHQHTFGTIAVDATGQPRNLGALPYFRR